MLVKDYDLIRVLIVDKRWADESDRLLGMIQSRGGFPSFFVDGKGSILPLERYDQFSPTPPVGWRFSPQGYYHFRGIQGIVRSAKELGVRNVLIVEDDCVFTDEFDEVVAAATAEGLTDWDMLYYGANHSNSKYLPITDHVQRVEGSLTTHCFAVRSTMYDAIINLEPTDMIDALIARELHPKFNCLAIWPNVALQKPGFSTLWHQYTDYSEYFKSRGRELL